MSEKRTKRPGDSLMTVGLVGAVLGIIFAVMGVANAGTPTPLAIVILIAGLIAAAVGFGRRVLAAVERR
jgi:lipopolysaccharide export LptBFGC system permease protein LptF